MTRRDEMFVVRASRDTTYVCLSGRHDLCSASRQAPCDCSCHARKGR